MAAWLEAQRLAAARKNRWVPVKNVELWQALDTLMARHDVRFTTIAGHSGHTENERCDELAVAAALQQMR